MCGHYGSAIVTSTSTPGSMLMDVTCFTVSELDRKSMIRLWMRIWKRSQVLDPSPHGVFRVVILSTLVGRRTGPYTSSFFSRDPLIRSAHTDSNHSHVRQQLGLWSERIPFSRLLTLVLVRVMRIRWICGCSSSTGF